MYLTGFADEAADTLEGQIAATKELGWSRIETRKLMSGNLASITDEEFAKVEELLAQSGVSFNGYGSGIANWSHPITEEAESSYEEMRRAIPRMQKLGIRMVRIMSFAVPDELKPKSWDFADEVVRRVSTIVKMAEDAGIVCLHENCMNWAGLSFEHTLYLLDHVKSPALRLVFDTGNPVFNRDIRGEAPYKSQSAWEFYKNVREFIAHVHIKDCYINEKNEPVFTYAGEGRGDVEQILRDLYATGYDGGISIEPHVATVFHAKEGEDKAEAMKKYRYDSYVKYGRGLESMVRKIGFVPA